MRETCGGRALTAGQGTPVASELELVVPGCTVGPSSVDGAHGLPARKERSPPLLFTQLCGQSPDQHAARRRARSLLPDLALLLASLGVFASAPSAAAAPGSRDTSFGGDGVATALGPGSEGRAVAVQADGRIVIAGSSHNGNDSDVAVVRFTATGSVDRTFSGDGIVTTDIGSGSEDYGTSMALQADGKIVVAGRSGGDFVVVRYKRDGTLDADFGSDGIVTTDISSNSNDYGEAVAVQADGKIVVAGYGWIGADTDVVVVRYKPDGTLDTAFGDDGIVTTDIGDGDGNDRAHAVALQTDGKIVVAGTSNATTEPNYYDNILVVRYTPAGALDVGFESNEEPLGGEESTPCEEGKLGHAGQGVVITCSGRYRNDFGRAVAVQADGRIVVAGYTSGDDVFLVGYLPDGDRDRTFKDDQDRNLIGKVLVHTNGSEQGRAVALQKDGKAVVVGVVDDRLLVFRYVTDPGGIDSDFGIVKLSVDGGAEGHAVALQADGKIVVGGTSNGRFLVARFHAETVSNPQPPGGDDPDDPGGDDPPPPPPPPPPGGGGGGFGGGGGGSRTTAPDSPQNLTAAGGDGQVVLSWDAPQEDGGSAITDYEFRNVGRAPWMSTASTDTTYTVTGLVNGTTYVFEVRAVNRGGKSFASNRVEATPAAPERFALDFAHFAAGAGTASELVLVNAASRPVRPAVHFYDTQGEPIAPESLLDLTDPLEVAEDGALTVSTAIEPLGDLTIAARGGEALLSGSLQVLSSGPIGGFVRYSVPGVGVAGVSAGAPVRDVLFPARRQQGGIRTAAALHNLEDEAVELNCRLLSAGAVLEEALIPLAAHGQTSWFIEDTFSATDTSDFAGTVRCTAPRDRRFTALAVQTDAARRIFTTLPLAEVDRTGGASARTTLDFAHFVNGGGAVSELVFVNRSPLASRPAPTPFHQDIPASRPAVYFYDTQGELIAPESLLDLTDDLEVTDDGAVTVSTALEPLTALTISTHGRGELLTGSVKVVSAGPIGGFVRFDLPEVGVAAAGAGAPVQDALLPVRRTDGGITTGIALHNRETSPALLTCELRRQGVLLDTASFPLAANGHTSWTIDQAFPPAAVSGFTGSLRCRAADEGRFTAVALETDPARRAFLTLPVTPVPEMPSRE